tara:strand:+ start:1063 stop:1377 length:315 start_codon:yes stop_codon:yes gene_type:complete
MKVTKKWIMKHRTDNGAWTKPQIKSLGIDWPPTEGWITRIEGKVISKEQADVFESKITTKLAKSKEPKFSDKKRFDFMEGRISLLTNRINSLALKLEMLEAKNG